MDISKIITVGVSRETKPISLKSFQTLLILGTNALFSERAKLFSSNELAALADDLTGGSAALEYIHASTVFGQERHIDSVLIGKKETGDTTWADALDAIVEDAFSFFAVAIIVRTKTDQKSVATWCQANGRVFVVSTADGDNIITPEGTDESIGAYVKAGALSNTTVIYHSKATTEAIDSALLGYVLSLTPGSYTGAFKTLAMVTVDVLPCSNSVTAHEKLVSTYESIVGRNGLFFSWVGSGEFLDIIIFVYWLIARLQEANILILLNSPKSSMTDKGISVHESACRKVLDTGIANGGISDHTFLTDGTRTGGYALEVPKASDLSVPDKLLRHLAGIKFRAFLAGAIHTIAIDGVLTI